MYDFPINTRSFPHVLPAYIEISKGSNIKYEWCEESKMLMLDRVLHSSVMYPENYGFIPQTLCDDGDPLDVLVLSHHKFQPGTIVHVRPICYMNMRDEKGRDEKLLAVPIKDPCFDEVKTMKDLSEFKLTVIKEFFKTYKNLEKDKWTLIEEWNDTEMSIKLIERTHSAYMNKI
jgi:inorganic pyrophosphatase